ncbi:hypothetical protein Tco_0188895 [Tanacetum coccineum]
MNVSSISEATQPALRGRLKRACKQISFLKTPTREVGLKNPYLICDYCGGSYEADKCDQNNPSEQLCLSGGDIYNEPSLLRFYQNDDTSPWGNNKRIEKGEDGPEWSIRSQFEDDLTNFMLEKKFHTKRIGDMLVQHSMIHMPKGANVLKDLLSHKKKLEKAASSVKLSEECSAIIQRNLPQKEGDLEMDEDELVPIILGRPFLATARVVIDVHKGKLSLRVRSKIVTFNIGKSMKSKYSCDDYLYYADHTAKLIQEQWVDTVNHDRKWTEDKEEKGSNNALAVSFYLRTEPVEPLE